MGTSAKRTDQIDELKRELVKLKVSISVLGDGSEGSKKLIQKRQSIEEEIKRLERGENSDQ